MKTVVWKNVSEFARDFDGKLRAVQNVLCKAAMKVAFMLDTTDIVNSENETEW